MRAVRSRVSFKRASTVVPFLHSISEHSGIWSSVASTLIEVNV